MIKDAELCLVVGRRGSGKSTRTRALISGRPKVVIFDPRAEYVGRGIIKCRTLPQVGAAIRRNFGRGFTIAYVPTPDLEIQCLDALCKALWKVQAPYDIGDDPRKLTLVVEEADLSMPVYRLPAALNGMATVINQGRHVGIEVIAVTQRPAQISMTYRANVADLYVFALGAAQDQKSMLGIIGAEWKEALRTLPNHSCLHMQNAQVRLHRQDKRGRLS